MDISKYNGQVFSKTSYPDITAQITKNFQEKHNHSMRLIAEEKERVERREEENRENLRIAAENSEIVIVKLEKQIQQKDEDLQNQRDLIKLLKNQLNGINKALNDMFILEEMSNEKQDEAMNIAREISELIRQKKRVDWKLVFADKGFDVVLTAIPLIIQSLSSI